MQRVVIWLDDIRDPDEEPSKSWLADRIRYESALTAEANEHADIVFWAKSYDEFVRRFVEVVGNPSYKLLAISFDNDLGEEVPGKEGRHAIQFVENYIREHDVSPFAIYVHTANPIARKAIQAAYRDIDRYWSEHGKETS